MGEKRRILGRTGDLVGDRVDKLLRKAEGVSPEQAYRDAARAERARARGTAGDTFEAMKERARLEREEKALASELEGWLDAQDEAEAKGNVAALAEIADELLPLAERYRDLQEELADADEQVAQITTELRESDARARRAEHDAARKALEHAKLKRDNARLARQLPDATGGPTLVDRNLERALEERDDLKDSNAALREALKMPELRGARGRELGESPSQAALRRVRGELGERSTDAKLDAARRAILDGRRTRTYGALGESEVPADRVDTPAAAADPVEEATPPAPPVQTTKAPKGAKGAGKPAAPADAPAAPERGMGE